MTLTSQPTTRPSNPKTLTRNILTLLKARTKKSLTSWGPVRNPAKIGQTSNGKPPKKIVNAKEMLTWRPAASLIAMIRIVVMTNIAVAAAAANIVQAARTNIQTIRVAVTRNAPAKKAATTLITTIKAKNPGNKSSVP